MDRLSNIEDIVEVGWVCVDQRPIKQALSSLTSKWKHVYASHLERQVCTKLKTTIVWPCPPQLQLIFPRDKGSGYKTNSTITAQNVVCNIVTVW